MKQKSKWWWKVNVNPNWSVLVTDYNPHPKVCSLADKRVYDAEYYLKYLTRK